MQYAAAGNDGAYAYGNWSCAPLLGTLIDGDYCRSDGAQIVCDQSPPLLQLPPDCAGERAGGLQWDALQRTWACACAPGFMGTLCLAPAPAPNDPPAASQPPLPPPPFGSDYGDDGDPMSSCITTYPCYVEIIAIFGNVTLMSTLMNITDEAYCPMSAAAANACYGVRACVGGAHARGWPQAGGRRACRNHADAGCPQPPHCVTCWPKRPADACGMTGAHAPMWADAWRSHWLTNAGNGVHLHSHRDDDRHACWLLLLLLLL
jgi:hypothetical protein